MKECYIDTIHQQHKLACEEVLHLYASIEAAIEDRRAGFAKDVSKNHKDSFKHRGSSVFESAAAHLPRVSSNLGEWRT